MTKRSSVWLEDARRCRTFQHRHPTRLPREKDQSPAWSRRAALCNGAWFRLPLLVLQRVRSPFNHFHEIAKCPESVCDASGHRGRATDRDVGFHEIVINSAGELSKPGASADDTRSE